MRDWRKVLMSSWEDWSGELESMHYCMTENWFKTYGERWFTFKYGNGKGIVGLWFGWDCMGDIDQRKIAEV